MDVTYFWRIGDQSVDQDVDGELKWHKTSLIHDFLDSLTIFGIFLKLFSEEISRRDVSETELLNELGALSSFTGGRSA